MVTTDEQEFELAAAADKERYANEMKNYQARKREASSESDSDSNSDSGSDSASSESDSASD